MVGLRRESCLVFISFGLAGTGRAFSEATKDSGHQGMLTKMHQGVGRQTDRSVPELAQYRIRLKSYICLLSDHGKHPLACSDIPF